MNPLLVILIVLLLCGGIGSGPWFPWSHDWGYAPSGTLTILLIVLIILALTGRL